MYSDDELIQLSAVQHFIFCRRQCALIHIEQLWVENMFTAEGRIMHDRAHEEGVSMRDGVRIERGIPLRSLCLGLSGKADVVEFVKDEKGKWQPFPIEYKRGKPKQDNCDKVQLCAQALCLEEMLSVTIPQGAIFYGKTRHRLDVAFDDVLRGETEETVTDVHVFLTEGVTPPAKYAKKCEACSLKSLCMPKTAGSARSVAGYLEQGIRAV